MTARTYSDLASQHLCLDGVVSVLGGGIDIEADDVFRLLGELRVLRDADAVWAELVSLEDALPPSAGWRSLSETGLIVPLWQGAALEMSLIPVLWHPD